MLPCNSSCWPQLHSNAGLMCHTFARLWQCYNWDSLPKFRSVFLYEQLEGDRSIWSVNDCFNARIFTSCPDASVITLVNMDTFCSSSEDRNLNVISIHAVDCLHRWTSQFSNVKGDTSLNSINNDVEADPSWPILARPRHCTSDWLYKLSVLGSSKAFATWLFISSLILAMPAWCWEPSCTLFFCGQLVDYHENVCQQKTEPTFCNKKVFFWM